MENTSEARVGYSEIARRNSQREKHSAGSTQKMSTVMLTRKILTNLSFKLPPDSRGASAASAPAIAAHHLCRVYWEGQAGQYVGDVAQNLTPSIPLPHMG